MLDYLIPSMEEQGIDRELITTYVDSTEQGCLESCMDAFSSCDKPGGTWHLQDDVILCSDFKERTEALDDGMVCGISTIYDRDKRYKIGQVDAQNMWYSFPCIRIPNDIARGCAEWYEKEIKYNPVYRDKVKEGKHDDEIFRDYVRLYHAKTKITNVAPNLVDHIDFLLGGSTVNKQRNTEVRALSFNEPELVTQLKINLQHD